MIQMIRKLQWIILQLQLQLELQLKVPMWIDVFFYTRLDLEDKKTLKSFNPVAPGAPITEQSLVIN
jgi:hypothetical protein